jgi:uncharacterized membrane-anchored protein
MNATTTRGLVFFAALLVLGAVNYSIYGKEETIRTGDVVYLELAPVDPRSLMQGDYMALRFRLTEHIESARANSTIGATVRSAPLSLDSRRVATLAAGDAALRMGYRIRGGTVWLGTNAYFFAEGSAERYSQARYGEFRINPLSGDAVLVGLADEGLNRL